MALGAEENVFAGDGWCRHAHLAHLVWGQDRKFPARFHHKYSALLAGEVNFPFRRDRRSREAFATGPEALLVILLPRRGFKAREHAIDVAAIQAVSVH